MTHEQIIQWAREAGCQIVDIPGVGMIARHNGRSVTNLIARVADIVAAATRDECAKVCENLSAKPELGLEIQDRMLLAAAKRIRDMNEKGTA